MSEQNICIIVDSGSDMLPDEAEKLGVKLLPLKVRFGDEEFDDGVTLSRDEFYNRLIESDELPKTSLIAPAVYEEAFRQEVKAGHKVVCLVISSGVSGCYQSALVAADDYEGDVFVIDTKQFCGPEYILTLRAVELRKAGFTAEEIAKVIEKEKTRVKVVALFDTLEYLKLGGRISAAAAGIGGMLSIKPVVSIKDGGVDVVGKARGSKNGNNHLMRFVEENGGIDWDKPIMLSWSGISDDLLEKYIEDSASLYEGRNAADLPRSRVGATIGTYSGPGAIAFSFYPKN